MQKIAQKFGNSSHIILPREMIGKKVKLLIETKTQREVREEILKFLQPYLQDIIAVYLYGSYSREEQELSSDIDLLILSKKKLELYHDEYNLVIITPEQLESAIKSTPVLILPIIRESIPIINPEPFSKYKNLSLTKENTKPFIKNCEKLLSLQKKGEELGIEVGGLVYSLILRLRSLYIIKTWNQHQYTKSSFFNFLQEAGFKKETIEELYTIYSQERKGIPIKESKLITKEHIIRLLTLAENLIKELS